MLERIADGRTDLVFEYVSGGHPASSKTNDGTSLIQLCAYYGDVSAIRFLLANGESLRSLGEDIGLNATAFHGHWRLCQFLIEKGADANSCFPDTAETSLHAAVSSARPAQHLVVKVLLESGADPNRTTNPSVETGLSCATAALEKKLRFIAPLPLRAKRRSSFSWTPAPKLTRKTRMAIRRSRGRAGTCVLIRFSESCAMVALRSVRIGFRWMRIYSDHRANSGCVSFMDSFWSDDGPSLN
jgi:hypothetical protein